jgi:type VI secretion system secreted protein Hcp
MWFAFQTPARSQATGHSAATVGVFLRIQGIEGESTDGGYEGWIDVDSFTYGVSRPAGSTAPANHRGFTLNKAVDKATPYLYLHCSSGRPLGEVVLEIVRTTADEISIQEYQLHNATVTSINTSVGANATRASERLMLSYESITWTYLKVDPANGGVISEVTVQWNQTGEED